jgi:hypothetical protein
LDLVWVVLPLEVVVVAVEQWSCVQRGWYLFSGVGEVLERVVIVAVVIVAAVAGELGMRKGLGRRWTVGFERPHVWRTDLLIAALRTSYVHYQEPIVEMRMVQEAVASTAGRGWQSGVDVQYEDAVVWMAPGHSEEYLVGWIGSRMTKMLSYMHQTQHQLMSVEAVATVAAAAAVVVRKDYQMSSFGKTRSVEVAGNQSAGVAGSPLVVVQILFAAAGIAVPANWSYWTAVVVAGSSVAGFVRLTQKSRSNLDLALCSASWGRLWGSAPGPVSESPYSYRYWIYSLASVLV